MLNIAHHHQTVLQDVLQVVNVADEVAATGFHPVLAMMKLQKLARSVSRGPVISFMSHLTALLPSLLCLINSAQMQPLIGKYTISACISINQSFNQSFICPQYNNNNE